MVSHPTTEIHANPRHIEGFARARPGDHPAPRAPIRHSGQGREPPCTPRLPSTDNRHATAIPCNDRTLPPIRSAATPSPPIPTLIRRSHLQYRNRRMDSPADAATWPVVSLPVDPVRSSDRSPPTGRLIHRSSAARRGPGWHRIPRPTSYLVALGPPAEGPTHRLQCPDTGYGSEPPPQPGDQRATIVRLLVGGEGDRRALSRERSNACVTSPSGLPRSRRSAGACQAGHGSRVPPPDSRRAGGRGSSQPARRSTTPRKKRSRTSV